MYARSSNITWRRGIVGEMLGALPVRPAAALAVTPILHLFTGGVLPNPDTLLADLVAAEATFTGYVAVTLPAWVGPVNALSDVIALIASGDFVVGSPAVITETITGYWVDYNAGADWLVAEAFPVAFPMANAGDFLQVDVLAGADLVLPVQ